MHIDWILNRICLAWKFIHALLVQHLTEENEAVEMSGCIACINWPLTKFMLFFSKDVCVGVQNRALVGVKYL